MGGSNIWGLRPAILRIVEVEIYATKSSRCLEVRESIRDVGEGWVAGLKVGGGEEEYGFGWNKILVSGR